MECLLVIDSGFSHTIVTPVYNGCPIQRAIRRLDFSGKHITNLLREVVSVRYFDLSQDIKVVNDIKEDVCFVSQDFRADMERTWKGNKDTRKTREPPSPPADPEPGDHDGEDDEMEVDEAEPERRADQKPPSPVQEEELRIDYVLPDGLHLTRGYARPHNPLASRSKKRKDPSGLPESDELSMTLGSERFTTPEILFTPSDIGSQQPGIGQVVMQSLSVLPPLLQATFLANVLVVGGNAKMPGFVQRVQSDVRSLAKDDWMVRVRCMDDPTTSTWLGGARLASNREAVRRIGVSKAEYDEHGSAWVGRRFARGCP